MSLSDLLQGYDAVEAGDEPLFLPPPEQQTQPTTRTLYEVGTLNTFDVEDGVQGGIVLPGPVRLIDFHGRHQENNNGVIQLVTFMRMVPTDEVVGIMNGDELEPCGPYADPAMASWNDRSVRPHRIYTQNWGSDPELVMTLANYLHNEEGWTVVKNPRSRTRDGGYERSTNDVFRLRPPRPEGQGENVTDWSQYGTAVDAFEISVNAGYWAGFRSFVHEVMDNGTRIKNGLIQARKQVDPAAREAAVNEIGRFADSITGYTRPSQNPEATGAARLEHTIWARQADVGRITIKGNDFPIWVGQQNEDLTLEDLAPKPSVSSESETLTAGDLVAPKVAQAW